MTLKIRDGYSCSFVMFSCKAGNPFFPQEEEDLQLAVLEHCVQGWGCGSVRCFRTLAYPFFGW